MKTNNWSWALGPVKGNLTITVDEQGCLAEHEGIPGAQVWVKRATVGGKSETSGVDIVRAESEAELRARAESEFRNRFLRHDLTIPRLPRRVPRGADVLEGLLELDCTVVNLCGTPRVLESRKGVRFLFVYSNDEEVPPLALPGLAKAAGVDVAALSKACGWSAARELANAREEAVRLARKRADEEAERLANQRRLTAAKQRAKEADEQARKADSEIQRLKSRLNP